MANEMETGMNRESQHKSRLNYWIGALAVAMALPAAAQADAWPRRPVTIVVGFAAGAGTDMLARAVADKLTGRLGQPVVVENKAGAGGSFAVSTVAAAAADGHTLLLAPNTVVISPHLMKTRTDILTDLVPVGQVTRSTLLLVTSPTAGLGVKDVKELTALARKKPGLSFGTAGMVLSPTLVCISPPGFSRSASPASV
jgi:tripartite-type tricarboxylate transporter receptor subunit TctC